MKGGESMGMLSYFLAGIGGAVVALAIWDTLSDNQKREIKDFITIHHGEIGFVSSLLGFLCTLLGDRRGKKLGWALLGFGGLLVLDDISDANKWFGGAP